MDTLFEYYNPEADHAAIENLNHFVPQMPQVEPYCVPLLNQPLVVPSVLSKHEIKVFASVLKLIHTLPKPVFDAQINIFLTTSEIFCPHTRDYYLTYGTNYRNKHLNI